MLSEVLFNIESNSVEADASLAIESKFTLRKIAIPEGSEIKDIVPENCYLVAYVTDNSSENKDVLQVTKIALSEILK